MKEKKKCGVSPTRFERITFRSGVAVNLLEEFKTWLGLKWELTTRYRCARGPWDD
ncbi:hypothetical protein BDV41DRAFT_95978 [Aspergillus transmontanensis]|uniref:Uncharacterized protein n=1 Tax=Aspergillus transmontanensis TaxID=1034304 RepID=A0A5N6W7J8_9EURO|nr:hypothetical protein BDV41DRAFT_95978 [Aspergillus transmontanensis]